MEKEVNTYVSNTISTKSKGIKKSSVKVKLGLIIELEQVT